MDKSELFNPTNSHCSLCGQCKKENITKNSNWSCNDENKTPFIRNNFFLEGTVLVKKGCNPDCLYKCNNKIIIIEIKDRDIRRIWPTDKDAKQFIKKIGNSYNQTINKGMKFKAIILLISSIRNSERTISKILQTSIEPLLNKYYLKIHKGEIYSYKELYLYKGRNSKEKIFIKRESKTKFFVKKCKDIDERFFNNIFSQKFLNKN